MRIRHAEDTDMDNVCDVLACEFFNDPVLKFAFAGPDPDSRLETMRQFFRIYVNLAKDYGGTLIDENDAGVLVYFRPELADMTGKENEALDAQLRRQCGSDYVSVAAFMNGLDHYHPATPPHYYVFLVAVQRAQRGTCLVNRLFSELNTILDRDKYPCYAECTRLSTRTLVRRFGYRDAGQPLNFKGFPPLYPIWREPQ